MGVGQMLRDARVDVFRGLALIIIFIDHVPGNLWSTYTPGNFGLSDAAEGFVLLSGISAGLAYGRAFRGPSRLLAPVCGRIWGRVWMIYLVHVLVTMMALAVAAWLALVFNRPEGFTLNQVNVVMDAPLQFLARMPVLAFHLDYGDILPLYVVLLAGAPLALWLGARWPWITAALAVLLWAAAGQFGWNLPNYPHARGWFFNPLAWQVIFVAGLLIGLAAGEGRRLVPLSRALQGLAAGIVAFALVLTLHPAAGGWFEDTLRGALQAGWPHYLITLEKTWLPLPRIVHALALAYLLSSFAGVARLCAGPVGAPFALLGRQSLPVFALGSVIVYLVQNLRAGAPIDPVQDTLWIAGGIVAMFALAACRQFWPQLRPKG